MREYVRFTKNKTVHGLIGMLLDVVEYALLSLFCIILLCIYVFRFATVQGDSMLPTLEEGNQLLVNALDMHPECGDIIIIDAQRAGLLRKETGEPYQIDGLHKVIVKRVVAVEGQTLELDFDKGLVYRDGVVLDEPYCNTMTTAPAVNAAFKYPMTIPKGYVFVMGDNRAVSMDSRYSDVGLVPVTEIEGKVVFRLRPEFGSLS